VTPVLSRIRPVYILDGLLLVVFLLGSYQCYMKPAIPVRWESSSINPMPVVEKTLPSETVVQFHVSDTIVSIAGHNINRFEDVERILDGLIKGKQYPVRVLRSYGETQFTVKLQPYYDWGYLVIQLSTAFLFFVMGFYVVITKRGEKEAALFHHVAMSIGGLVMLTVASYTALPIYLGHILHALNPACYLLTGLFMFHFGLVFPRPVPAAKWIVHSIYWITGIVAVLSFVASLIATTNDSLSLATYFYLSVAVSQIWLIAGSLFAIGVFIYRLLKGREIADRLRLKWVLFGTSITMFTYIFLWYLPNKLATIHILPEPLLSLAKSISVPEWFLLLAVSFSGVTMMVAILRYRAFDIDILIRRSSVYGLVFGLLLVLYVVLLAILFTVFEKEGPQAKLLYATGVMLLNLLLFLPARGLVERFLNRYFYHVKYNYHEAAKKFSNKITQCVDATLIAEILVEETRSLIAVEQIAFLRYDENGQLATVAHYPIVQDEETGGIQLPLDLINTSSRIPIAHSMHVESEAGFQPANAVELSDRGIAIVFPLLAEDDRILGFLVLGNKKSGNRYSVEDIDLLRMVTNQAATQIDRILLQQKLWAEKEEASRLAELSQMKSYFVSSVTHDLKTPITSVKMFAELMHSKTAPDDGASDKYLNIIEGECDRLIRLINNVLDYAKMEQGIKTYSFERKDLCAILQRTIDINCYQLEMSGFKVESFIPDEPLYMNIDEDAVIQAVTNLITNAVKYSTKTKYLSVSVQVNSDFTMISIEDHGVGIAKEDIPRLFDAYYRSSESHIQSQSGAGLGLSLVKHIMEAHGGSIQIASEPGKGSTFTLLFNSDEEHEKHIDN
jgi:signal transduction histidine kinase